MRTFKFRFWDSFNECYCYSEKQTSLYGFFNLFEATKQGKNNPILQQFTGIEDNNEKEVYEGDIHLSEVEDDGKIIKGYLPIVFDNGAFWLDQSFKKDGTYLTLLCEYDEPLNIVGNIYENAELLKIR